MQTFSLGVNVQAIKVARKLFEMRFEREVVLPKRYRKDVLKKTKSLQVILTFRE